MTEYNTCDKQLFKTDKEHLRAGVELADGWTLETGDLVHHKDAWQLFPISELPQTIKDAIAAQLVHQVDELNSMRTHIRDQNAKAFSSDEYGTARVWTSESGLGFGRIAKANDNDRTMNTIKAIVDSGVLSTDQGGRDG